MKPLRHIDDFLDLAARHACSNAAARAVREGTYSTPQRVILPWGNKGWRFTVTSQRGSKWSFCIEVLEEERKYRITSRRINDTPD